MLTPDPLIMDTSDFLPPDLDVLNDNIDTLGLLVVYGFVTPFKQWTLSLYWGFESLTNAGYANIVPDNYFEIVWAEILSVLQVVFFAYILG